jgi:hypothetical protein
VLDSASSGVIQEELCQESWIPKDFFDPIGNDIRVGGDHAAFAGHEADRFVRTASFEALGVFDAKPSCNFCHPCGCREPYPSRSGYGAVLVNQPGNNIGSLHVFRFGIGDRDDHFGDR